MLRGVGEVIRSGVRKIDTAARYGGDEFVVLLPETDPTGAWVLAEKVRIGVTELSVTVGSGEIPASISVGVVSFPDDGQTSDQLMISADQAMYALEARLARTASWASRSRVGLGARQGRRCSHHPATAGPRASPRDRDSRPGRSGRPTDCRGSTSVRPRSRSTRPSRSPATTRLSSATS